MSDKLESYSYSAQAPWIQLICPAPKRFLQDLIKKLNLKNGLDIGCGGGSLLTAVRSEAFESTGIDISEASINRSKIHNVHDKYIVGDFRSKGFSKKYDVVVLSHVIEHFSRDEGLEIIRRVENLANRLVYIETPHGFLEQTDYDGNPFQRHLSGWFPHDFEGRGYSVFGSGVKGITGPMGKASFLPTSIVRFINRSMQWHQFRRPKTSSTISAIRYMDEFGNIHRL
jgi:SAM-dependent methyltransferase